MIFGLTYEVWQVLGVILSSIISTLAFLWTLHESKKNAVLSRKMVEETTRPILSIYTEHTNTGSLTFYLVIKNFGKSQAFIDKIDDYGEIGKLEGYFVDAYGDLLSDLCNSTLAPDQSRIIALNFSALEGKTIKYDLYYHSTTSSYKESCVLSITAGVKSPRVKSDGDILREISYTLKRCCSANYDSNPMIRITMVTSCIMMAGIAMKRITFCIKSSECHFSIISSMFFPFFPVLSEV